MRVSEVDESVIAQYCRIEDVESLETESLTAMKSAALSFIRGYTGLTDEQIDEHEDITIALLVIVQDMYDNRTLYVDSSNINRVVDAILGMHSVNLL